MTLLHRTEICIDASPEHVFRFFVDSDWLTKWLGKTAQLVPQPGGEFRFEVAAGEWCVGEYVVIDSPRRVVFTWGWENETMNLPPGSSVVEVNLTADGERTKVSLTHRELPDDDSLALHADGWMRYLARLERVARGLEPGPDPAAETPDQARQRLESR